MARQNKKPLAVLLCSDSNLAWQAAFALERFMAFAKNDTTDFFYFHNAPIPEQIQPIFNPKITRIFTKTSRSFDQRTFQPHLTQAAYLRFDAIRALSEDYDHVLYYDVDIFLRWGDVADLMQIELGDHPIAAVSDISWWPDNRPTKSPAYVAGLPAGAQQKYLNSGMLLVQTAPYLDLDINTRVFEVLDTKPELCAYGDQSALNHVLDGDWVELSPSWNWQCGLSINHMIASRNPRVVHFLGRRKPWSDPLRHNSEIYWFTMRDYLLRHGLFDILDSMPSALIDPANERRRSRELRDRYADPFASRKSILQYIERPDFADVQAGLPAYGWNSDPFRGSNDRYLAHQPLTSE